MTKRINWIIYEGKRILYADLSKITSQEELQKALDEATREIMSQPKNSTLYLVNMENGFVTPQALSLYKDGSAKIQPYLISWGVIGLNRIKSMITELMRKTVGLDIKVYQTKEEAMRSLAKLKD